jgi:hypothetical protein
VRSVWQSEGFNLEGWKLGSRIQAFRSLRTALGLAGVAVTAVPVAEGLDVAAGVQTAPGAKLAVVTPGQQAPLGMTMSLPRRLALLAWARRNDTWIIEDDYPSELQLKGWAAPALASLDHGGRVLHVGSFSKTISPALRLGFMVVPPELGRRFAEFAASLAPAPAAGMQRAGRSLSSSFAAHEAALRRPTGEPASFPGRNGARLDKSAGDRGSCSGDLASQVHVRRGRRFTRARVRPRAASDVGVVHATSPAAGTIALRDQPQ